MSYALFLTKAQRLSHRLAACTFVERKKIKKNSPPLSKQYRNESNE